MTVETRTLSDVFFSFALPDSGVWPHQGSLPNLLLRSGMPGAELKIDLATFFGPHVIVAVRPPECMGRGIAMFGLLTEKVDFHLFMRWLNEMGMPRLVSGNSTWEHLEARLPEVSAPHWEQMRFACEQVHSRLLLQRMNPQLAALNAASRLHGMHCNVMGAQMDAVQRGKQMPEQVFVNWYIKKMSEL